MPSCPPEQQGNGLTPEQRRLLCDSRLYRVQKDGEGWVIEHTEVPAAFTARRGEKPGELVVTSNTHGTYVTTGEGLPEPERPGLLLPRLGEAPRGAVLQAHGGPPRCGGVLTAAARGEAGSAGPPRRGAAVN
ncbi:MAG: hypothetical protein HY320_08395 [Armatimonadetes bacterium]|nr:hypothetical protein [Armatimonadota bacterium]